jgi:hypothetical protein
MFVKFVTQKNGSRCSISITFIGISNDLTHVLEGKTTEFLLTVMVKELAGTAKKI